MKHIQSHLDHSKRSTRTAEGGHKKHAKKRVISPLELHEPYRSSESDPPLGLSKNIRPNSSDLSRFVDHRTSSHNHSGFKGAKGYEESKIYKGFEGSKGTKGIKCYKGTKGIKGIKGAKGTKGTKDSKDTVGCKGCKGTSDIFCKDSAKFKERIDSKGSTVFKGSKFTGPRFLLDKSNTGKKIRNPKELGNHRIRNVDESRSKKLSKSSKSLDSSDSLESLESIESLDSLEELETHEALKALKELKRREAKIDQENRSSIVYMHGNKKQRKQHYRYSDSDSSYSDQSDYYTYAESEVSEIAGDGTKSSADDYELEELKFPEIEPRKFGPRGVAKAVYASSTATIGWLYKTFYETPHKLYSQAAPQQRNLGKAGFKAPKAAVRYIK